MHVDELHATRNLLIREDGLKTRGDIPQLLGRLGVCKGRDESKDLGIGLTHRKERGKTLKHLDPGDHLKNTLGDRVCASL